MNFVSNIMPKELYSGSNENINQTHEFKSLMDGTGRSFLANFQEIPLNQPIYGCFELNSQFQYSFSADFYKNLLAKHELPSSLDVNELFAETSTQFSNQICINDHQPLLKRFFNIYLDTGLIGVCEELNTISTSSSPTSKLKSQVPNSIVKLAGFIIKFSDFIYGPINPLILTNKIIEFDLFKLKGEQWESSLIRSFQWHPFLNKFAVAFKNDTIKIYSTNQPTITLKHPKQIKVTCMAWKPFYPSIIAIGCANCIIIWDTETIPLTIKPSSSCSFVLSKRHHNDIIDLKWYPKSEYLLSIATKDNQIMIWDITLKKCIPIKRIGSSGFSLARFSPNGFKLFTADLSSTFRIWNPVNFTSEKWTNLSSKCNSACWSNDGSVLLFSCHGCSILYALKFLTNNRQEIQILCDLSSIFQTQMDENDSQYSVGGAINDMVLDPSGQRLAVSFKKYENQMNLNVVAIFNIEFQPQLRIFPCGLVCDTVNSNQRLNTSWPATICFKPKFELGALLTIGWSNCRIQHVPFYFSKLSEEFNTRLSFNF